MKRGLTLIECMIYLTLLLIISGVVCTWITHIIQLYKDDDQALVLHLAHDMLYKDIASGSESAALWDIGDNRLVIKHPKHKVTWYIKSGNRLVRSMDRFDEHKKEWVHTHSAQVAHPVDQLAVSLGGTAHQHTAYVTLRGMNNKKPYVISTVIALQGGHTL